MFTTTSLGPRREADLINIWGAVQAHGERVLGFAHLPADRLIATPFGLGVDQSGATQKWAPSGPRKAGHLVDTVVLDDFGVHALINQEVGNLEAGIFVAICPAHHLPAAAQYLL